MPKDNEVSEEATFAQLEGAKPALRQVSWDSGFVAFPFDPAGNSTAQPVPKPDLEILKDGHSLLYCSWAGCTEEAKFFDTDSWRYEFNPLVL
jgi:hypothetical protein